MCTKSKNHAMNIPDLLSGTMEMYRYSSGVWSVRVRSYRSWVWFFRYAICRRLYRYFNENIDINVNIKLKLDILSLLTRSNYKLSTARTLSYL